MASVEYSRFFLDEEKEEKEEEEGSKMVKLLCDNDILGGVPFERQQTLLYLTVQNPQLSSHIKRHLVGYNRYPNINASTILQAAVKKGKHEICQILVEFYPEVSAITDENGRLPLHVAALSDSEDVLDLMCGITDNINVSDDFGKTPVYYALMNKQLDHLRVLKTFVEYGGIRSSTERCDSTGHQTILHIAATQGLYSVCEFILEFDPYMALILDSNQKMPIEYAISYSNISAAETMMKILKSYNNNHNTSLKTKRLIRRTCIRILEHIIAENDFYAAIFKLKLLDDLMSIFFDCLINAGAKVDDVDHFSKSTALHLAIKNGYIQSIGYLIEHGTKEDALDSEKNIPLHIAMKQGSLEAVQLLQHSLHSTDLINAVNADGDTPLSCGIAGSSPAHVQCVKELLTHHPNLQSLGSSKDAPILQAVMKSDHTATELFSLLLEKTTNMNIIVEAFQILLINTNFKRENYSIVFNTLVHVCNTEVHISTILKTIMDKCRKAYSFDLLFEFLKQLLLQEKILMIKTAFEKMCESDDMRDSEGFLPIHMVAKYGSDSIFQVLIETGCCKYLDSETYTFDYKCNILQLALENDRILETTLCDIIDDKIKDPDAVMNAYKFNLWLQRAMKCNRNSVVETIVGKYNIGKGYMFGSLQHPVHLYSKIGTSTKTYRKILTLCKDFYTTDEKTPIQLCLENVPELQVCFLKECLRHNPDCVSVSCARGYTEMTESILHTAVKMGLVDVCRYILSIRPQLANMVDIHGYRPIFYAIGHSKCNALILLLLDHTGDLNGILDEKTAIAALENKELPMDIFKVLISKGLRCCDGTKMHKDKNVVMWRNEMKWLSGHCPAFRDKMYDILMAKRVHAAVNSCQYEQLSEVVCTYSDLNLVDSSHMTPLHVAVMNKDIVLESIKALVENGAMVNIVGGNMMETPLLMAMKGKRFDVCHYLLTQGAEPGIADKSGNSPIHEALQICDFDLFVAMVHVTKDLNKCNSKGQSLLQVAVEESAIPYQFTESLITKDADVNFHAHYLKKALLDYFISSHVQPLQASTAQQKAAYHAQPNLLLTAVCSRRVEVVKLLCSQRLVTTNKLLEYTAVHSLISLNDVPFAMSVLKDLLKTGINIDQLDTKDNLALDLAALQGNHGLTDLLIVNGADVSGTIGRQCTLLHILEYNCWNPTVILSLIQGGYKLNDVCQGCTMCQWEQKPCLKLICAIIRDKSNTSIMAGFRLVFQIAISLSIPMIDCGIESDKCGALLGSNIQQRLCEIVNNPRPLTILCRDIIREHLLHEPSGQKRRFISQKVDGLPVPKMMKILLKLEHVDIDGIENSLQVPVPPSYDLPWNYTNQNLPMSMDAYDGYDNYDYDYHEYDYEYEDDASNYSDNDSNYGMGWD